MRITIANYEPNRTGGGWSFANNLASALGDDFTTNYNDADVYLIASASMVQRADVEKAKADGKKIVLRVDNAVRNSRNRNTGMTRMKDFAEWADLIVYQSRWAKSYLMEYLKKDGVVILNGVDTKVFNPGNGKRTPNTYLYSRYNRDETKNWEVARYWFSRKAVEKPDAKLTIVGQFSDELRAGNFDFYNGEKYKYLGTLDKQAMADIYRANEFFLYTYYNDCCSNSLIEAICCDCKIAGEAYYYFTGGAAEIMAETDMKTMKEKLKFWSKERMAKEYKEAIEKL